MTTMLIPGKLYKISKKYGNNCPRDRSLRSFFSRPFPSEPVDRLSEYPKLVFYNIDKTVLLFTNHDLEWLHFLGPDGRICFDDYRGITKERLNNLYIQQT